MTVSIEEKKSFIVIGKLGQGFSAERQNWIPAIWQEANSKFEELDKMDDSIL